VHRKRIGCPVGAKLADEACIDFWQRVRQMRTQFGTLTRKPEFDPNRCFQFKHFMNNDLSHKWPSYSADGTGIAR
jgi:hypothetical protein